MDRTEVTKRIGALTALPLFQDGGGSIILNSSIGG